MSTSTPGRDVHYFIARKGVFGTVYIYSYLTTVMRPRLGFYTFMVAADPVYNRATRHLQKSSHLATRFSCPSIVVPSFSQPVALRPEGLDAKSSCPAPSRAPCPPVEYCYVLSPSVLLSLSSRTHSHGPATRHHMSFLSCDTSKSRE